MSLKTHMARQEVIDTSLKSQELRLVVGTWGNISCRIREEGVEDLVAITPSGVEYERLEVESIPLVDLDGNVVQSSFKPSGELPLHLAIYRARPDVNAIVHTHSVHCTAMAIAHKPIPASCEDLVQITGGEVRCAAYALPGTQELADHVVKALEGRQAAIMASHGLVAVGATLQEALKVALVCEKSAHATILAASLGGAVVLSDEDVEIMRDFYVNKYGQR